MLATFGDYNHRRIHSALKYMMPSEFAEQYRQGGHIARTAIRPAAECVGVANRQGAGEDDPERPDQLPQHLECMQGYRLHLVQVREDMI